MTQEQTTRTSKFLSLVLRHQPETAHITLDAAGCAKVRRDITCAQLDEIVATNAKKRFEFSADGTCIRASQGHSVEVDLNYESKEPPPILITAPRRDFSKASASKVC